VLELLCSAWEDVVQVDLTDPHRDFSQIRPGKGDVCLFAIPVFEGRVPAVFLERICQVHAQDAPAVLVAVFGNRAVDDALLELEDALVERGFRPFAAVSAVAQHSLLPSVAAGRPDEEDAAELRAFSLRLKEALAAGTYTVPVPVPGSRPYRIIGGGSPTYPSYDAAACVKCMTCARGCPTEAISKDDPSQVDRARCIRCMRCVSACPTGAWHMDSGYQAAVLQRLEHLFQGRKENVLYL